MAILPGTTFCWVLREDRPSTDETNLRVFMTLEAAIAWVQVYYKGWFIVDGQTIEPDDDHVVWIDCEGAYLHLERAIIEDA